MVKEINMEYVNVKDPYDETRREDEYKTDCLRYGLSYTPSINEVLENRVNKLEKMKRMLESSIRQLNMEMIELLKKGDKQ